MPIDQIGIEGLASSAQIPAGAVMNFARSTPPSGWIKANGAAVSRTTYAALFAAIGTTFGAGDGSTTFNVPDLRGEFQRGWDDGRGVDSGRVFGSSQLDQFQGARIRWAQGTTVNTNATTYVGTGTGTFYTNLSPALPTDGVFYDTLSTFGTPRFGAETRARNIALLTCIKT